MNTNSAALTGFDADTVSLLAGELQTDLHHWLLDAFRDAGDELPAVSVPLQIGEAEADRGCGFPGAPRPGRRPVCTDGRKRRA
jgi:hypothetical protein